MFKVNISFVFIFLLLYTVRLQITSQKYTEHPARLLGLVPDSPRRYYPDSYA